MYIVNSDDFLTNKLQMLGNTYKNATKYNPQYADKAGKSVFQSLFHTA